MEQRGGTGSSSLVTVLVDHTPQVVTTQRCKPKARLLTSAECLKMLQEDKRNNKQRKRNKSEKSRSRKNSNKARNIKTDGCMLSALKIQF